MEYERPFAHMTSSMKKWQSPGPAAYNTRSTFGNVPTIKIGYRPTSKQEGNRAPYYNTRTSMTDVTKVTIGPKTKTKDREQTPGPKYIPPKFGADAKHISFSSFDKYNSKDSSARRAMTSYEKRRKQDETPGPGPGTYNTRDHTFDPNKNNNGVKIKGHHDFRYNEGQSPGPAAYKPLYKNVLPQEPVVAIHVKSEKKDPETTPGYRNLGSTLGGPRFTIKARNTDEINIV